MVSPKNSSGQQQPVSLVMVSAKGRVAVYDLSLKLAAAFTLRMCSAPVASIKTPLSIPSVGTGTAANRPTSSSAPAISYNASASQKVFFFYYTFNAELQCTFLRPFILPPATEHAKRIISQWPTRIDENNRAQIFQSFRLIDDRLFFLLIIQKEQRYLDTWIPLKDWLLFFWSLWYLSRSENLKKLMCINTFTFSSKVAVYKWTEPNNRRRLLRPFFLPPFPLFEWR